MGSKSEVLELIEKTKKSFLSVDKDKLYNMYNGVSELLLAYKYANGNTGWSKKIVDTSGNAIYTSEEQVSIESGFKTLSQFIDPVLFNIPAKRQKGGATVVNIEPKNQWGKVDPDSISIDKAYHAFSEFIRDLDQTNRDYAKNLGPFRKFNEMGDQHIPLPPPFSPTISEILIPERSIVPMIMYFLESIRLMVSFGPLSNELLRKISTLILAFADVANGSWKNAILTSLGLFGTTPLLIGITGKFMNNTLELIAPDIRERLSFEIFNSVKSILVGPFFYLFSILAPDNKRKEVIDSFSKLSDTVDRFIEARDGALNTTKETVNLSKYDVIAKKIPIDRVPTLEHIQNLQSLIHMPQILCSTVVQATINDLKKEVGPRIILELLGVPTQDEDMERMCRGIPPDMGTALAEPYTVKLKPTPEPESQPINNNPTNPDSKKSFAPTQTRKRPQQPKQPKQPKQKGGKRSSRSTRRRRRNRCNRRNSL
jgi:hypothetical protein